MQLTVHHSVNQSQSSSNYCFNPITANSYAMVTASVFSDYNATNVIVVIDNSSLGLIPAVQAGI